MFGPVFCVVFSFLSGVNFWFLHDFWQFLYLKNDNPRPTSSRSEKNKHIVFNEAIRHFGYVTHSVIMLTTHSSSSFIWSSVTSRSDLLELSNGMWVCVCACVWMTMENGGRFCSPSTSRTACVRHLRCSKTISPVWRRVRFCVIYEAS